MIEPGAVIKGDERLTLVIAASRRASGPPPACYDADMLCAVPWNGRVLRHDMLWDDAWIVIRP